MISYLELKMWGLKKITISLFLIFVMIFSYSMFVQKQIDGHINAINTGDEAIDLSASFSFPYNSDKFEGFKARISKIRDIDRWDYYFSNVDEVEINVSGTVKTFRAVTFYLSDNLWDYFGVNGDIVFYNSIGLTLPDSNTSAFFKARNESFALSSTYYSSPISQKSEFRAEYTHAIFFMNYKKMPADVVEDAIQIYEMNARKPSITFRLFGYLDASIPSNQIRGTIQEIKDEITTIIDETGIFPDFEFRTSRLENSVYSMELGVILDLVEKQLGFFIVAYLVIEFGFAVYVWSLIDQLKHEISLLIDRGIPPNRLILSIFIGYSFPAILGYVIVRVISIVISMSEIVISEVIDALILPFLLSYLTLVNAILAVNLNRIKAIHLPPRLKSGKFKMKYLIYVFVGSFIITATLISTFVILGVMSNTLSEETLSIPISIFTLTFFTVVAYKYPSIFLFQKNPYRREMMLQVFHRKRLALFILTFLVFFQMFSVAELYGPYVTTGRSSPIPFGDMQLDFQQTTKKETIIGISNGLGNISSIGGFANFLLTPITFPQLSFSTYVIIVNLSRIPSSKIPGLSPEFPNNFLVPSFLMEQLKDFNVIEIAQGDKSHSVPIAHLAERSKQLWTPLGMNYPVIDLGLWESLGFDTYNSIMAFSSILFLSSKLVLDETFYETLGIADIYVSISEIPQVVNGYEEEFKNNLVVSMAAIIILSYFSYFIFFDKRFWEDIASISRKFGLATAQRFFFVEPIFFVGQYILLGIFNGSILGFVFSQDSVRQELRHNPSLLSQYFQVIALVVLIVYGMMFAIHWINFHRIRSNVQNGK